MDNISIGRVDESLIGDPFKSASKIKTAPQDSSKVPEWVACKHEWHFLRTVKSDDEFYCTLCLARAMRYIERNGVGRFVVYKSVEVRDGSA